MVHTRVVTRDLRVVVPKDVLAGIGVEVREPVVDTLGIVGVLDGEQLETSPVREGAFPLDQRFTVGRSAP